MVTTDAWRRNLRLFVAYRAVSALYVYIAVSLPFYQSLGFNLAEIGVLHAITGLTTAALDIPTGFVADRIDYRSMMIAGNIMLAASFGALAFTHTQWLVYVLHFALGVGHATCRGIDAPLARKSAEAIDADFNVYSRASIAATGITEGIAAVSAGLLVLRWPTEGPRWAVGMQAVIYVLILYIPWRMREEPPTRSVRRGNMLVLAFNRLWALLKIVRDELSKNHEARWLILYGAVTGCTTQTVFNLVQPYFQELRLTQWHFTVWWAGYCWLLAIFSLLAGLYERWLGRWGALASLVVWGIVANGAMALFGGVAGLAMMAAFCLVRGIQMPIVLDYMTGVVPYDRRATFLAVQSTIQFVMYGIMNTVLGYVAEYHSVKAAFAVSLVVYGAFGLLFISLLRASHRP